MEIFSISGGIGALLLGLGILGGYIIRQQLAQKQANSIEAKLKERIEKVKEEAKKLILDAKNKAADIIKETEEKERKHKDQLTKLEERLLRREDTLDKLQEDLTQKEEHNKQVAQELQGIKDQLSKLEQESLKKLEGITHLTVEEAKEEIMKKAQDKYKKDILTRLNYLEKEGKEALEAKSKEIMADAIQRYARSNVSEVTTSIVDLPSEDVKGKIIGKEGRNIHHFEKLTGVELIMDDSPDTVVLSCFNPLRREVAKIALKKLIQDGRIQPARIEEKIAEAQSELRRIIQKKGEEAAYEVGILDLPPELIQLLGRLAFRTSYGQNVLTHSIEVAFLSEAIAEELGGNKEIAKKAGLLHDIGKAIDQEVEGTHLELGRKILMKYKMPEEIIKAMQSHHGDYPVETIEAAAVNAADAISASRPGARRENLEEYLKRLSNLEQIALAKPGVKKAYAISAGRELRVFVSPDKVDDLEAMKLAHDISAQIQEELKYPGEIKVVVLRETRAIDVAH